MSTTRSVSPLLLLIITILIFVSVSLAADDLRGAGHTMPAFIDVEFSVQRVNEPAGAVAINIIRSGDYRQTTTIDYHTSEIDASEGADYKGSGGTITFQPGEGYKTVILDILSDDFLEEPESFAFEITSAGPNTVLSSPSCVVWIDDHPAPISPPTLEIVAGADNTVLLSWESARPCALERSNDPAAAVWEPVNCSPDTNGSRSQVIQQFDGTIYFYRLRAD